MIKCANPNCNNDVFSKKGYRKKQTCSNSCRMVVFKNRKKEEKYAGFVTIPIADYERYKKIERENDLLRVKNSNKSIDTGEVLVDNLKNKEFPTDYNGWLNMAKNGVDDVEVFKLALSSSNLNARQKDMVLAKI